MRRVGRFLLLAVGTAQACSSWDPSLDLPQPVEEQELEPLLAPQLRLVSPPSLAAGDLVMALGQGFLPPSQGRTLLLLDGEFAPTADEEPVEVHSEVETRFQNQGLVEFIFEPDHPPSGFGHRLGLFEGTAIVVNVRGGSRSPPSDPVPVRIDVRPSLIVWSLRPLGADCRQARVLETVSGRSASAGARMAVSLQAIGMVPIDSHAPLTFRASYVDLAGEARSQTSQAGPDSVAAMVLEFGSLTWGQIEGATQLTLEVRGGSHEALVRTLKLSFRREYTVAYDGNRRLVELYAPVQASACIPGGPYGRTASYTRGQGETRSRSVSASASLGLDLWVFNAGFGFSVTDTVSSAHSASLSMSGFILPNQYGVFYRQTQRLIRTGHIVKLGICGSRIVVGNAEVTDWDWAPDLAITTNSQCPPPPASNLPRAQRLE